MSQNTTIVTVALSTSALLALHAAYYFPFFPDDAFISLRYAKRLLQGEGLTWTSGPRVEGYSNFLWTLLVAALGRLGLDLVFAARLLGAVSSLSVLAALLYAHRRLGLWSMSAATLGCLLWALSGPIAVWTLAGLEHTLVAALLSWAVVLCLGLQRTTATLRALWVPGALLGTLALARLDAPLYVVVIGAWWWWTAGRDHAALRQSGALLLIPALAMIAQQAFRLAYYGEWASNVAHAKLAFSRTHFLAGTQYVFEGWAALRPLGELGFAALAWLTLRPSTRRSTLLVLALMLAWLGYVALVGRDLFPGWRQLVPAVLLLIFGAVMGVDAIRSLDFVQRRTRSLHVVGVIALVLFTWNQLRNVENQRAKTERWEQNGEVVGRALRAGFATQQPLLAVMAGGAVPYWAELDCLDMFGLADRHIARVRTSEWGRGKLGHETRDAAYVLARQPDLILFGTPGGYEPSVYVEGMGDMPAFRDNYERCNISGNEPHFFNSRMWVNKNSPRIGIRRTPTEIEVPSYLLNITGSAIARLDDKQRFYVYASQEAPVGIATLALESGRWNVIEPTGDMRVLVNDRSKGFREAVLDDGVRSFSVDSTGTYDILVVPESDSLRVYRLHLVHE